MNYIDVILQQKYELEQKGKKPVVIKCSAEVFENLKFSQDMLTTDNSYIYGLKIIIDNEKTLEVL